MTGNNFLNEKRNIVIFGAGPIGKAFYQRYYDDCTFAAFTDNNEKKHGKRYFGLSIISPEDILNLDNVVVVVCVRNHYDVAQQLFNMGIKSFWLSCDEYPLGARNISFGEVAFLNFSQYESLAYNPRRVTLLDSRHVGGNCYALLKYGNSKKIEWCFTTIHDNNFDFNRNAEHYYAFYTSALVVTEHITRAPGKKLVELWHGFTIKALWGASHDELAKTNLEFVLKALEDCSAICSYSKLYSDLFGACLNQKVEREKFVITGMPRNDLLLRTDGQQKIMELFPKGSFKKIIAYTPTFRECVAYSYRSLAEGAIFTWDGYSSNNLESFLAEQDILLLVKIHGSELVQYNIAETEHIRIIRNDLLMANNIHFYELLSGVDLLISDYSSIWVDYLLLNRPIIFAVRDLEDYKKVHGLMIEPFDAWAPGEIVTDFNQLKNAIAMAFNKTDDYALKRSLLTHIYHKYTEGNSSERVIELLENELAGNLTGGI